ncbi:MAG: DUF5681 domain-containing protein [Parasphingopyxis sp.]
MGKQPEKSGRKQDGTFAPGYSGNPAGKPKGARHLITRAVEELLDGEHEALTRAAIDKALEGDTTALRLCLDRIAPPKKDGPVSIELPVVKTAQDAVDASAAVLLAVGAGDITPDEAGRVMALLDAHRRVVETSELEERISKLEAVK